ncbi:hypothetical protein SDC9_208297 [bioreactor metagenome]|uniref:Uncharacterized protein n=1 Tax=bioreactor metagenome TaxID=1076179 RepID=A0A645JA86_9ZZZZ
MACRYAARSPKTVPSKSRRGSMAVGGNRRRAGGLWNNRGKQHGTQIAGGHHAGNHPHPHVDAKLTFQAANRCWWKPPKPRKRWAAPRMYWTMISVESQRRPSSSAAFAVVYEPPKGSTTRSPGLDMNSTRKEAKDRGIGAPCAGRPAERASRLY